ncbi:MAG: S-methyl-5-thioribose-1-phosphate isomerase [Planctomycetota bacterium]
MLEQTRLPKRFEYIEVRTLSATIAAIRRLAVRGAPAIGCSAAYGMVIGLRSTRARTRDAFFRDLRRVKDRLAASRPTAVNLFWALDRMERFAESLDFPEGVDAVLEALLGEARAIHDEDRELCRAIGAHGAKLLKSGQSVLTHCNAGALATGGMGTALAVIYQAAAKGKRLRVFADETRPLLQGARLTSFELQQAGIDVTVICDNAAASIMRHGEIHAVVVGADRIALNGDVANKIGTYGVAVLAREHGIPFYVAAPSTTFDRKIAKGDDIPIEERRSEEVTRGFGTTTAPDGVDVCNPAFDVTPARYVSGIITEHGVLEKPYRAAIRRMLRNSGD